MFACGMVLLLGTIAAAACPPATVTFTAENARVVIAADAPKTVRFAAEEATNFLAQALGAPVPLVTAPEEGRANLVLGDNAWSRREGLDVASLAYDGFYLLSAPDRVYIAGRDDPEKDTRLVLSRVEPGGWRYERATLYGVYEFLERFAGVRFYFPGELGTVVPCVDVLSVCVNEVFAPRCIKRWWSGPFSRTLWFDGVRGLAKNRLELLNKFRLRESTLDPPTVHGTRFMQLERRFAKAHPEYFAQTGTDAGGRAIRRCDPSNDPAKGGRSVHLCWSSKVVDELCADVKAYCSGLPASSRGYAGDWPSEVFFDGKYTAAFDIDDAFVPCRCAACQAGYETNRTAYATTFVWSKWAGAMRRLEAEGAKGLNSFVCAYSRYQDMPDFDLPRSLYVGVATDGPWSMQPGERARQEVGKIADWFGKTGGSPLHLHNWALKYREYDIPGLPSVSPRSVGAYYEQVLPMVRSVLMESSSERFSHVYLNVYLMARMAWSPQFDWRRALDEHDRLMFGPAASEMREVYAALEDAWVNGVMSGRQHYDELGPLRTVPSRFVIWGRLYSSDRLRKMRSLFDAARAEVAPGSPEARRIALFRREYCEPLEEGQRAFAEETSIPREEARRAGTSAPNLLPPEAEATLRLEGESKRIFPCEIRPNTTYRLSCYVNASVEPEWNHCSAGLTVGWFDAKSNWAFVSGGRAIKGETLGWVHQSAVVRTGPEVDILNRGVYVWLRRAKGFAEVKGLRLEEVTAAE